MFRDANGNEMNRNYQIEAATGKIAEAMPFTVFANVIGIANNTPMLAWELQTPYTFLAVPHMLELVSNSNNDTALGTGARLVLITLLDANYNEVTVTVIPNAGVPVPVPGGPYLHHNQSLVIEHGSTFTNVGNLTVRVAAGGSVVGYVAAGIGVSRQGVFTVPAGRAFLVQNFFYTYAVAGQGAGGLLFKPFLRFPNGGLFQGIWQNLNSGMENNTILPIPFTLAEKMSFGFNLEGASGKGIFAFGATGLLRSL